VKILFFLSINIETIQQLILIRVIYKNAIEKEFIIQTSINEKTEPPARLPTDSRQYTVPVEEFFNEHEENSLQAKGKKKPVRKVKGNIIQKVPATI